MKVAMVCVAAFGAALTFAMPASAKSWKDHGGHGYGHSYKSVRVMPLRSNKGGYLRGHARARYVHSLNRARRYGY